jgi:hypothetical protein
MVFVAWVRWAPAMQGRGSAAVRRGQAAQPLSRQTLLIPAVLVLGRRREVREVALDACGEVVRVARLDDPERGLPLRALAAAPGVGPESILEAHTEPGPLRTHDGGHGQCEQREVQPAHGSILPQG